MKGIVAKNIENKTIFHGDFHFKQLVVKLVGQPILKIKDRNSVTDKKEKSFALHLISKLTTYKSTEEVTQKQIQKTNERKERNKSRNLFVRMFSSDSRLEKNEFKYAFELTIGEKDLLFFV